jgi:hypothetical protein
MAGYETIISGTSPSITAVTQLDGTPIFSATTGGITFGVPVSGAGGYATGVRQIVSSLSGTVQTITTQIPADGTIPQNTEGTQIASVTITPQSATSFLRVDVVIPTFTVTVNITPVAAIFRDSDVGALAASAGQVSINNTNFRTFSAIVASGSTAATTFKLRFGPNAAATIFVNGYAGPTTFFGGVSQTGLIVTEYGA